jgi:hypothetical protein
MFRHVPVPGFHTGDRVDLAAWLKTRLLPAKFSGSEEVLHGVERKQCGLLFKDFKPAYGRPGAYLAKPESIVVTFQAFGPALEGGNVIVPIGDIDYSDSNVRFVLQHCARQWCGGGRGDVNMSDNNVLIMYYSAIQSLLFEFVKSPTMDQLDYWAVPLIALVRNLAKLHDCIPQAKKVTEALITVPCPDDMLQKALGHVFADVKPTFEDQVEMLENIVKRMYRAEKTIKVSSSAPLVVFLLTPLLSSVLKGSGDIHADADTFVKTFNDAIGAFSEAIPSKEIHPSKEVRSIMALTKFAFLKPLTKVQIDGFLAMTKACPTAPVPWSSLGVLPKQQALVPSVHTDSFEVRGKPAATLPAVIRPKSPNSFTAIGRKGTEWTGIQLLSSGVYTINLTALGTAEAALGDSRGEDLKANLRLTLGKDIMTPTEHSYSLAGMMQYKPITGELRNLWHIRQCEPMLLDKPITVTVKKEEVTLTQNGLQFAKFPRGSKPVLVAFKNVLLSVEFDELSAQAPQTATLNELSQTANTKKTASMFAKLSEED